MNFDISPEMELLRKGARQIGQDYGLDYWRDKDAKHAFPSELWNALGETGYIGLAIDEKYGGAGLGMAEMAMVIDELAASGAGSTIGQLFMVTPIFGGMTIQRHGSAAQKDFFLPKIASGEINFCMALTEPNSGSNTLEMTTSAVKHGNKYIINGQKIWISGVRTADYMLIIARTTPSDKVAKKTQGISLFVVSTNNSAINLQNIEKLGTNCLSSDVVFIDNLEVDEDSLIGREGEGWYQLLDTLNAERIVTTAGCTGAGDLAIKLAVDYSKNRKVFRDPIATYQGIQFPLARLRADLELARLMNYKAAWLFDNKKPSGREANIAKMVAAEAGFQAADQAIQTMGGYGYSKEYYVERIWRDIRLFRIAPVSHEMILNFIAQHDLGLPRSY